MNESKKKVDFSSLDFSKINGAITQKEGITDSEIKVEADSNLIKEGIWINGKNNKDVSPEEFRDWLANLLPSTGVAEWDLNSFSTPSKRERLLVKTSSSFDKLFCFPKKEVKDNKYNNN
jgi:hypothetical protein